MNEKQTNKKEQRRFAAYLISILSLSIIIGCQNPIASIGNPALPDGKGSFSLTLSEISSRTILPEIPGLNDFAVYNLNFSPTSGGVAVSVDRTNATLTTDPVILDPGTYSLVVNAYKDSNKAQLIAQGTTDGITISAGKNTRTSVTLIALLSGGSGTFRWDIPIPFDVNSASMTITPGNEGGTAVQTVPLSQFNTAGNRTLNSGPYNLTFIMEKADGKTLVWNELLYIYRNLESVFNHTFTDTHFNDSGYTVTYKYNDGGLTVDGAQSVLHGGTAARPNDPVRNGYTFGGWYYDNNTFANAWDFNLPVIDSFTLFAKWDIVPVDSITLDVGSLILTAYPPPRIDTVTITAIIWPINAINQEVSWSSSNTAVTVDRNGVVRAVSPGRAIITASVGGHTAECVIFVYNPVNENRFQVMPNPDSGKVMYSYSYDRFDFLKIYLGQMANIPMFYTDAASINWQHQFDEGFRFDYSESVLEQNEIRRIISNSSSIARTVVEENTEADDEGELTGWEKWSSVKWGTDNDFLTLLFENGNKDYGETYWNNYTSKTVSESFEVTSSVEDTVEMATLHAVQNAKNYGYTLSLNNRPGHYRLTMKAVSDVYINVIRDKVTGVFFYEFIEHIVPGIYSWDVEYTAKLPFGKTDASGFVIDVSLFDNLPLAGTIFNTVTFDKNNIDTGSTEASPNVMTINSQATISGVLPPPPTVGMLPAPPARAGWTFIGWNTKLDGTGTALNSNTPVTANITVYAQWACVLNTLNVTASPIVGGNVTPISQSSITLGTQVNIAATPASGYRFTNWSAEDGTVIFTNANNASTTVTVNSNATIRANFERVYTLTVSRNPTAGGTVTPVTQDITAGTPINITASPAPGYRFINWILVSGMATFANANSASTAVTLSLDATIRANFEPITLTVDRNIAAGGTVNPTSRSNVVAETPVSISASPAGHYRFVNWTVVSGTDTTKIANPASQNTTVTLSSNATVRANFQLVTYSLTTMQYPTNWGTVSRGSNESHSALTPISISATARSGYKFVNWTVANGTATFGNASSASTTVTLSSNATIRANFLPTNAVFGGEVGKLSLKNSAAFSLRLRIQYWNNNGIEDEYRFGDTNNPSARTIDPGRDCENKIADGSWVRVYSFVVLGNSKQGAEYFLYRSGNPRTAYYRHTGSTLSNTLHYDGAN